MSYSNQRTFTASSTAITKYRLCKTPAAAVVTTAATEEPFGVSQDGIAASGKGTFVTSGETRAVASAAIAIGAILMPGSSGRVTTHDDNANSVKIGRALTAAGADGDYLTIELDIVKSIADA